MKASIACIQEKHFRNDAIPKLKDQNYLHVFRATSATSKTKGVSILISKDTPFQLLDTLLNPEGCYIFLKGKLGARPVSIANIYAPNSKQVAFFRQIGDLLTLFANGILILSGDFNVPLNPLLDSSSGTSELPYRALKQIKLQLQGLMLHDTWHTLKPQEKPYFSPIHQKHSRIDYIFLSQADLTYLQQATIEPIILSDHYPITMMLQFPEQVTKTKIWRLNTSLLKDLLEIQRYIEAIIEYFTLNKTSDTSPITQWEAHKCVLRGKVLATA